MASSFLIMPLDFNTAIFTASRISELGPFQKVLLGFLMFYIEMLARKSLMLLVNSSYQYCNDTLRVL